MNTYDNATHVVEGVHRMCRNPPTYFSQRCHLLGEVTPGGRIKVLKYGYLFWTVSEHQKLNPVVAYVAASKVSKR